MERAGKIFFKGSVGILFMLFAVMVASSCRSTKKITRAISKKDTTIAKNDTTSPEDLHADSMRFIQQVYSRVRSNMIDCKTFSAKLKVHYEVSDGRDYNFTA